MTAAILHGLLPKWIKFKRNIYIMEVLFEKMFEKITSYFNLRF